MVNLKANSALDYTNNAYIMQSNLIAYDQWNTQKVTSSGLEDSTFVPNTQVNNSISSIYNHYINHGIVVNRTGWDNNYTVPTIAAPPFNSPITTPETASADYSFIGYYYYHTTSTNWDGSKKTNKYYRDTTSPYPEFDSGERESLNSYISRMEGKTLPIISTDCALSAYRSGINYAVSTNYLTYLPVPDETPDDDPGRGSFITKMYRQTDYNGHNKDDGRRETQCGMRVKLYNYSPGNSAANPNMFLWSSKDSYNPCNY